MPKPAKARKSAAAKKPSPFNTAEENVVVEKVKELNKQLLKAPHTENGKQLTLSQRLGIVAPTAPVVSPEDAPLVIKCGKTPTAEQELILREARKMLPVLVIEAGAGTGKTTTFRMLADVLTGNGQYTAFNSSLVAESKAKFQGTNVACNTTHSLAFRAEGKRYAHRLNGGRVRSYQIAQTLGIEQMTVQVGSDEANTKTLTSGFLASQVMGAIKRFCQSEDRDITANHFRYIDGIDLPADGSRTYDNNDKVRKYLLPYAQAAWIDLCSKDGQLPFSHDVYVKIWQLNNPVIAGDYILLDESQDTAGVMLDILKQQRIPVILVGDSAQQIYEWRGAINAMAAFPDAPRLMLSQSFRFGTAIADVANAVLNTLEEPTPLRLKGLPSIPSRIEAVANPTAILCRTNAVAVSTMLAAVANGKRPYLVGGGSDVVSFVEAAAELQAGNATNHVDLACFSSWSEVQEYVKLDEGEDLKLMVKLVDTFGSATILTALKSMPTESDADLVICTAHKSKGREWDTVQLAADFPTKSKCGDSDRKLLYVAVTRAKLVLDITRCPFFTGQDALDISSVIQPIAKLEGGESVVPPTPVQPAKRNDFTWANIDGSWLVRGPKGHSGETVTVVRRDGSTAKRTLGSVVKDFGDVCIYRV